MNDSTNGKTLFGIASWCSKLSSEYRQAVDNAGLLDSTLAEQWKKRSDVLRLFADEIAELSDHSLEHAPHHQFINGEVPNFRQNRTGVLNALLQRRVSNFVREELTLLTKVTAMLEKDPLGPVIREALADLRHHLEHSIRDHRASKEAA